MIEKHPESEIDRVDRLSNLPEHLICYILSFLPTKDAAATSILSSRWRYTFLSVPVIDLEFDDSSLHPQPPIQTGNHSNKTPWDYQRDFMHFFQRLLLFFELSCVTEFRIKGPTLSPVHFMVSMMLGHHIQVIDINSDSVYIPSEILACKTLVVLKLQCGSVLQVPKLVCMPKLKVLGLEFLTLKCDDGAATCLDFFEGLPLLEDLWIYLVNIDKIDEIAIFNPSLKTLFWHLYSTIKRVVINTPNLVKFVGIGSTMISTCKLKSLIRADLSPEWPQAPPSPPLVSRFIAEMSNVKFLTLTRGCLKDLYQSHYSFPEFPNLTRLELGVITDWNWNWNWKVLEDLLHCAPNLEMLVCNLSPSSIFTCVFTSVSLDYKAQEKPFCLVQKLKKVTIKNFNGHEFEFELVRFLLGNGALLEEMSICVPRHGISKGCSLLVFKKLLKLHRCSKICKIVLKGKTWQNRCLQALFSKRWNFILSK